MEHSRVVEIVALNYTVCIAGAAAVHAHLKVLVVYLYYVEAELAVSEKA